MSPTEFQVSVTQPELRVTVKQPEVLVATPLNPEVLVVTANNIGLPGPQGEPGPPGIQGPPGSGGGAGGILDISDIKTSSYTVLPSDEVIRVDNSSGSAFYTLPLAASVPGKTYYFHKVNSYVPFSCVVQTANHSEDVEADVDRFSSGSCYLGLRDLGSYTMTSDGVSWLLPTTFDFSRIWYVCSDVNASGNDGHSPQNAMYSLQEAIDSAISGDEIVVMGDVYGPALIENKILRIRGEGQRPVIHLDDWMIAGNELNFDDYVVQFKNCVGGGLHNITIQTPHASVWCGVGLKMDASAQMSFNQVNIFTAPGGTPTRYATAPGNDTTHPATSNGGIGISVNSGEGSVFTDIHIGGCSIGLAAGMEGSVNMIVRGTFVSCFQEIVFGLWTNCPAKTTLAASATTGASNIKYNDLPEMEFDPTFEAGRSIIIGSGATREIVTITTMGTSGAGGTGITLTSPLIHDHVDDDWVVLIRTDIENINGHYAPGPWPYGGGNCGGWTFITVKDTVPIYQEDGATPVIDFIGAVTQEARDQAYDTTNPADTNITNYGAGNNGAMTLIACDFSESGGLSVVRFGSSGNRLLGFTSAPNTLVKFEGQRNHISGSGSVGAGWVINSDYNIIDGGSSNGCISGEGSYNDFRNVNFHSSSANHFQLTGIGNKFDERCTFNSGLADYDPEGNEITLTTLGVGTKFAREEAVIPLNYTASVTIDVRKGTHFPLNIIDGNPWTLEAPIDSNNDHPENILLSKTITLQLNNSSGGLGGEITTNEVWQLLTPLVAPDNDEWLTLTVIFNGLKWIEVGRISSAVLPSSFADVLSTSGNPEGNPITGPIKIELSDTDINALKISVISENSSIWADVVTSLSPNTWYRFDEPIGEGGFADSGVGGFGGLTAYGTLGAPSLLAGDPDNDSLTVDPAHGTETQASTPHLDTGTVIAWIKTPDAGSGLRSIIFKRYSWGLFLEDNVFKAYHTDIGSGSYESSGVNIADNIPHMISLVFDATVTDGSQCFVDGMPAGSPYTMPVISNHAYTLQLWRDTDNGQHPLNLIADEYVIFNYKLTPTQIASLYAAGMGGLSSPSIDITAKGAFRLYEQSDPDNPPAGTALLYLQTGGVAVVLFPTGDPIPIATEL